MACGTSHRCAIFLIVVLVGWGWGCKVTEGLGLFEFDFHHRFSDHVKQVLGFHDFPRENSLDYYKALVHHDGRRLQSTQDKAPVTFADGNETFRIDALAFLHYANVTVGTPGKWFLVALDTGSDLFWLPCDCTSCVKSLPLSNGRALELNIYSPKESKTSSNVTCNSTMCSQTRRNACASDLDACRYQNRYLSANTSSTGILVGDVLHLTTENNGSKGVDAPITLGCGQVQTGGFLRGGAINGLFGLGFEDYSVPSILAKAGIASNSFSMCFGPDRTGRISFGDKGSSNQSETPLNPAQIRQTYNISITRISVGGKESAIEFSALFDTGTSFTYLLEPQYTFLTQTFDSAAQDKRVTLDPSMPFEYCYQLSSDLNVKFPTTVLTMEGRDPYELYLPILPVTLDGENIYCLSVIRSEDFGINIIGQNFMTGYRIVFDRERMVLRWKQSNCYNDNSVSTTGMVPLPPRDGATNPKLGNGPFEGSSRSLDPFAWIVVAVLISIQILF